MNSLLEGIRNIDVATTAREVWDFIAAVDPFLLVIVFLVPIFLGARMAAPFPRLRSWGFRAAVGSSLLYLGYVHFFKGGINADNYPVELARAILVGEVLLIPLWNVLPIFLFILTRIRLVLLAFLGYFAYAVLKNGSVEVDQLSGMALGGLITAAVVLLIAWILQPLTDYLAAQFVKKPKAGRQEIPLPRKLLEEGSPLAGREGGTGIKKL